VGKVAFDGGESFSEVFTGDFGVVVGLDVDPEHVTQSWCARESQASDIRAWLSELRTKCQCCALADPRCWQVALSASSIRYILRVLRAALQGAVDQELLVRKRRAAA
jgi:hypothetical protein